MNDTRSQHSKRAVVCVGHPKLEELIMNRSLRVSTRAAAAIAAAFSILAGASATYAEDAAGAKTLFPTHGVSIDVGSKRVIGYFVASKDTCNLTFLMSDKQVEDEVPASSAARLQQSIAANGKARVDTAEGESLELACQPGASAMTVRLLTQVASYKDAK
jgi:hypothetical protein